MGFRRWGWALLKFGLAWTLMLGGGLAVEERMLAAQATGAGPTTTGAGYGVPGGWDGGLGDGAGELAGVFDFAGGLSVPAGSTPVTIGFGGCAEREPGAEMRGRTRWGATIRRCTT